jgi:hypothetical protein
MGEGSRVTASIHCGGSLENTNLWFTYDVALFSGGWLFASGNISAPDIQSSGANIYAPTQNGAATAPVILVFDATGTANAGWWRISLNRTTLVTTIEYNDVDLPEVDDKRAWTMTPDKCVVNSF